MLQLLILILPVSVMNLMIKRILELRTDIKPSSSISSSITEKAIGFYESSIMMIMNLSYLFLLLIVTGLNISAQRNKDYSSYSLYIVSIYLLISLLVSINLILISSLFYNSIFLIFNASLFVIIIFETILFIIGTVSKSYHQNIQYQFYILMIFYLILLLNILSELLMIFGILSLNNMLKKGNADIRTKLPKRYPFMMSGSSLINLFGKSRIDSMKMYDRNRFNIELKNYKRNHPRK